MTLWVPKCGALKAGFLDLGFLDTMKKTLEKTPKAAPMKMKLTSKAPAMKKTSNHAAYQVKKAPPAPLPPGKAPPAPNTQIQKTTKAPPPNAKFAMGKPPPPVPKAMPKTKKRQVAGNSGSAGGTASPSGSTASSRGTLIQNIPRGSAGAWKRKAEREPMSVEEQLAEAKATINQKRRHLAECWQFVGEERRQLDEEETQLAEEEAEIEKLINSLHPPLEEDPIPISSEEEVEVKVEEESDDDSVESVKWDWAVWWATIVEHGDSRDNIKHIPKQFTPCRYYFKGGSCHALHCRFSHDPLFDDERFIYAFQNLKWARPRWR